LDPNFATVRGGRFSAAFTRLLLLLVIGDVVLEDSALVSRCLEDKNQSLSLGLSLETKVLELSGLYINDQLITCQFILHI